MFFGKTLYSHSAFLHPGVYMVGTSQLNPGGNPAMDYNRIQGVGGWGGGGTNTPSRFITESGISSGLALMQTLPYVKCA